MMDFNDLTAAAYTREVWNKSWWHVGVASMAGAWGMRRQCRNIDNCGFSRLWGANTVATKSKAAAKEDLDISGSCNVVL